MATEQTIKSVTDHLAALEGLSVADQADYWVIQLDDQMDENGEMAFRIWLKEDPSHRTAYDNSRHIWSLAGLAANDAASDTNPKLATKVTLPQPASSRFCQTILPWMMAIMILLAGGLYWASQSRILQDTVMMAGADFRTFQLEDGSTATLDAGAKVNIHFDKQTRHVDLKEGGVFVEVTPNKNRPFIVSLGDVKAVAVGTAYSVENIGGDIRISVLEGVVRVEDNEKSETAIQLRAGQSWIRKQGQNIANITGDISSAEAFWRRQQLKSDNQPLDQILTALYHHSGSEILWIEPEISDIRLSGLFQLKDAAFLAEHLEKKYHIEKYSIFGKSVLFLKKS